MHVESEETLITDAYREFERNAVSRDQLEQYTMRACTRAAAAIISSAAARFSRLCSAAPSGV